MSDVQPARRYERSGTGLEFDRVAFFSDAVYAIAMTLLVVGIGFPHVRDSQLGSKLASLDSEIISFFIGFVILGSYWISHHALTARLKAVDTTFLAINLLYLAVVAFLPFPTAVIGSNGSVPLAIVVFACSLAAVSILEVVLHVCAHRRDLLTDRPSDAEYRHDIVAGLIPGLVFLLSLPLAFVATNFALVSWVLIVPAERIVDRVLVVPPRA